MVQYILWNTKIPCDRTAAGRFQHGPMNVSQCVAVTAATGCCDRNDQRDVLQATIEHDGRLAVIGPAGTGKTITLINLLEVLLNSNVTARPCRNGNSFEK